MLRAPLILLLAPLLFPAMAAAQAPAETHSTGAPRSAGAARVTELDFLTGDEVEGTRETPAGAFTEGRNGHGRPSLVRVRESFRSALLDSAESL